MDFSGVNLSSLKRGPKETKDLTFQPLFSILFLYNGAGFMKRIHSPFPLFTKKKRYCPPSRTHSVQPSLIRPTD